MFNPTSSKFNSIQFNSKFNSKFNSNQPWRDLTATFQSAGLSARGGGGLGGGMFVGPPLGPVTVNCVRAFIMDARAYGQETKSKEIGAGGKTHLGRPQGSCCRLPFADDVVIVAPEMPRGGEQRVHLDYIYDIGRRGWPLHLYTRLAVASVPLQSKTCFYTAQGSRNKTVLF